MSSSNGTSTMERTHPSVWEDEATPLSNAALEAKAKQLREESARLSQTLTQRLASSQSGQNLLHMGTSLSTLPPDLHSLLQSLHPVLSATEGTEKKLLSVLEKIVTIQTEIRNQEQRSQSAAMAADLYQDLIAAEMTVRRDVHQRRYGSHDVDQSDHRGDAGKLEDGELDHAVSLERSAHVTLLLLLELQRANTSLSAALATQQDTEHEQFVVKLAPRIRRLEADATQCLCQNLEVTLKQLMQWNQHQPQQITTYYDKEKRQEMLLLLGHYMRGLALFGRAKEVESTFARTAIMPLVKNKVSMGRLDEGGSRGECAGLKKLLADMVQEIAENYRPVLQLAEAMFSVRGLDSNNSTAAVSLDVDLVTEGVWVPIATALMADAGIKMAIFSPGIASILQANYLALDAFLANLARKLLHNESDSADTEEQKKYFQPAITDERITHAQERIYAHPKTAEFSKKWNLPIYYQLRFGDCCTRLNKAVDQTSREGWVSNVFTGSEEQMTFLRQKLGFELSLFMELYETLLSFWSPDVILKPLTNRFLRGSVQLVGRIVSFIEEGMNGDIMFGEEPAKLEEPKSDESVTTNGSGVSDQLAPPPPTSYPTHKPYCWGESEENVASVAWELTILESTLRHDYASVICEAFSSNTDDSDAERTEIRTLVVDVLGEAADQIHPVVDKAWNQFVVGILTQKCSTPLAAVKGVAATYRMTNRPPPTQASPFVATILRPLKEFDNEFANRTPDHVGKKWKHQIISTLSDRYAAAVSELLATVERTEVALKNRKARRTTAGGMSDGEKVKLQLYLDYQAFTRFVREVGVEPASVIGLSKLAEITVEGEKLCKGTENGS